MASNLPRATIGTRFEEAEEEEVDDDAIVEFDDDGKFDDTSGDLQSPSPHSSRSCGEPRPHETGAAVEIVALLGGLV